MLEQHREEVEGGFLTFQAGCFYLLEDPLRQSLIDAKKAVPESEHKPAPEVAPIPEGVLDVPAPPEVAPIEVTNG
jgi:hypothetical protein